KADQKEDLAGHEKSHQGKKTQWTPSRKFNLLVEAKLGVVEEAKQKVYLRGEITQGVHVNFKNVLDSTRLQIPFGIAQIGKAFRNEINPGNFTFRSREFEQMELQFYIKPEESQARKWYEYWKKERMNWYRTLQHQKSSGQDMQYFDQETGKHYLPWIIETSGGVDRAALFFLIDAYNEDKDPSTNSGQGRVVLKLNPKLAPVKVAVFPLLANKPELVKKARLVRELLTVNRELLPIAWDERGNIGKRYYSQDEIGTPYCVTIDFKTLEDDTVTIRDRDTTKQERVDRKFGLNP
ncbi:MAG: Glycine-tRNA ligase, partial [Candidatus Curtissbacteria bacterium GW2011_GWB1_40_28]